MAKQGKNDWFDEQFGSSGQFGSRQGASKGNKGTNFWGKGLFTFNAKGPDIMEKAKLLNAIKNFVRIQTSMNIPVKYSTKGDESYTDGETIVIANNVQDGFDSHVGLALHEASHIKLTDFGFLRKMKSNPSSVLDSKYHNFTELIKQIHNWVEDRYIDNWSYTTAPGYKIYYLELYKRYFHSEEINNILKSGKILDVSTGTLKDISVELVENYMFYLINLTNENIKLNELKGLQEIWDLVDLAKIDRLTETKDRLTIATGIFDIIQKYVPKQNMEQFNNQNMPQQGDGDEEGGEGEGEGEDDGTEFDGNLEDLQKAMKEGKQGKGGKPIKLSQRLRKLLKEQMEKQKQFVKGKVEKQKMDESDSKKVSALIESETEEHPVRTKRHDFEVITVNKVTMDTIESGIYRILDKYAGNLDAVEQGLILGQMLGRKLQVRTEERVLISNRLPSGKIDKRNLHGAGAGLETIFYTKSIDKYEDMSIHISLDLSGSMQGEKWTQTLISTIAIAKATSMIKGIRTQISLRYSDCISNKEQPIVICFYDSLHDSVSKLRWFEYVHPDGATPEGLCYEALMKKIMKPLLNKNTLFINFSDGAPGMSGLGGDDGIDVTRDAINKMRGAGVKILSYFIGSEGGSCGESFRRMYSDRDSKFIDVNEIAPLAKSINDSFLQVGKTNV